MKGMCSAISDLSSYTVIIYKTWGESLNMPSWLFALSLQTLWSLECTWEPVSKTEDNASAEQATSSAALSTVLSVVRWYSQNASSLSPWLVILAALLYQLGLQTNFMVSLLTRVQ